MALDQARVNVDRRHGKKGRNYDGSIAWTMEETYDRFFRQAYSIGINWNRDTDQQSIIDQLVIIF